MATYKLATGGVVRSDGAFIPADARNIDFQAYQNWILAGNLPTAADPALVIRPSVTADQVLTILQTKGVLTAQDVTGAVSVVVTGGLA